MFEAECSFVDAARKALRGARNAVADHDFETACHTMSDVAAQAYNVKARAIAQSFETAYDFAEQHNEAQTLAQLAGTARLIEQFATGLAEVNTPEAIAIYHAGSQSEHRPNDQLGASIKAPAPELEDKAQQAASTLKSLLPHAQPEERKALQSLIAHSGQAVDIPRPLETVQLMPFEQLMVPLTNAVLGQAWRNEQRVSLSYNCGDVMFVARAAQPLTQFLTKRIAARLGCQDIGAPVHIALSLEDNGGEISIIIKDGLSLDISDEEIFPLSELTAYAARQIPLAYGTKIVLTPKPTSHQELNVDSLDDTAMDPGDYLSEALA